MIFLTRLRYTKIVRLYRADIWGNIRYKRRLNLLIKKLKLYRLDRRFKYRFTRLGRELYKPKRIPRFPKSLLLLGRKYYPKKPKRLKIFTIMVREKQKFKAYYLLRTDRECQRLLDISRKQFVRGNFTSLFLFRLESRLLSFLFRSNIYLTPLVADLAIKKGYVKVNNKVITKPTYNIKIGDYVSFKPFAINKKEFIVRARKGLFKFRPMPWTFFSFYSFTFYVWRLPAVRELDFPFELNLGRALKYFKR